MAEFSLVSSRLLFICSMQDGSIVDKVGLLQMTNFYLTQVHSHTQYKPMTEAVIMVEQLE